MNEIQQALYRTVVEPALRRRQQDVRGVIVDYNNDTNTATVEFQSPDNESTAIMEHVPVNIGAGGVHAAGPFEGDEVWISFVNGNIALPQVISVIDRNYGLSTKESRLKHVEKGAYVPDSICTRT